MKILQYLHDYSLIIIPSSLREKLLLEIDKNNLIYNIKLYSLEEFMNELFFTYDQKAIYYLMTKNKINSSIAKIVLDNLLYLNNNSYNEQKLYDLLELKKDLMEKGLLKTNPLFSKVLQNYDLYIYGYNYIDNFYLNELKKLNVNFINEDNLNKKLICYSFFDISEEVDYIFKKIIFLIDNNIELNKIKLCFSDEYRELIKRYAQFYQIPLNINENNNLYQTCLGQDFLHLLRENIDVNLTLGALKDKYQNNIDIDTYNLLIMAINNVLTTDNFDCYYDLIVNELKDSRLKTLKYDNALNEVNFFDYVNIDDYVFVLGFNLDNIPKVIKDNDYLNDSLKEVLNLDQTFIKNKKIKESSYVWLTNINNLMLTYKLKTPTNTYYPSPLINEKNIEVHEINDQSNSCSSIINQLVISKEIDNLIKYQKSSLRLNELYYNYPHLYLTYDNSFKGINNELLLKHLNNKVLLSYSSIDTYYHCPFRYYLNNVLHLNLIPDSFPIFIGNLTHYLLANCFNSDFDFDKNYREYLLKRELTIKEKVLLKKIVDEIKFIINTIKKQNTYCSFDKAYYEKKIYIEATHNITFMGIIDKILYKCDSDNTYLSIIDYKTGNVSLKLDNVFYGLDLQLPSYLYLVRRSTIFTNPKIVGFYLQKILHNEVTSDGDNYNDEKENRLKLIGYSTSNRVALELFDREYFASKVIKGMRLTKDDSFAKNSRVFSDEIIIKLDNLVQNKISEAGHNILAGVFPIKPKVIENVNIGCEYCSFKDICFLKEEDKEYLPKKKIIELEGDEE